MSEVVFMFPGQGSQFAGMATSLREDRRFDRAMDDCLEALGEVGHRCATAWTSGDPDLVDVGSISQPLLMAVGTAMAACAEDALGRPADIVVGHSIGEIAAAHHAGVLDLRATGTVCAERARLLDEGPRGRLIGVAGTCEAVGDALTGLPEPVCIAAVNGPRQVVVAAPEHLVSAARAALRTAGLATMLAGATEPFHSPVMGEVARRFTAALAGVPRALAARSRMVSSLTAADLQDVEAVDPAFWGMQLARRIRFWDAMRHLDAPGRVFVETGPGRVLSGAARQLTSVREGTSRVVTMFPSSRTDRSGAAWRESLTTLAGLG